MLGTRTKQVYAYGRRGQRIVNATAEEKAHTGDALDVASKVLVSCSRRREVDQNGDILTRHGRNSRAIESELSSPKRDISKRKRKSNSAKQRIELGAFDTDFRDTQKPFYKVDAIDVDFRTAHAQRIPLSTVSSNVSSPRAAPQVLRKPRVSGGTAKSRGTPSKSLAPASPEIQVDIVVLDHAGRKVSEERRVSRPNVKVNAPAKARQALQKCNESAGFPTRDIIILSDSDDSGSSKLQVPRKSGRARAIIISSDEEDSDVGTKLPSVPITHHKRSKSSSISRSKVDSDGDGKRKPTTGITRPSSPRRAQISRSHTTSEILQSQQQLRPSAATTELPGTAKIKVQTQATSQSRPGVPASILSPLAPRRTHHNGYSYGSRHGLSPAQHRYGRNAFLYQPSLSDEEDHESDAGFDSLEFELSQLELSPSDLLAVRDAPPPAYLQPLLHECRQTTPHDFSTFIKMFPRDPLVRLHDDRKSTTTVPTFRKVGEASYSEVFGIGDVVLKVIPIRDESANGQREEEEEGPPPSDAKDVLKEIIVTRAMGELCTGFVELLRAYVVRGKYPSVLLDLWDEYEDKKGSESVRPDMFTVSQVYAIIVLPNGGPDLEAYAFPTAAVAVKTRTASPWRQACSIFWQVARTLATAENLVRFEHRDLHWGQILVKCITEDTSQSRKGKRKIPMDDDAHGIQVTVIDLGLARMDSIEGKGVHWTPFDDEVFEGEGDYQFDVYRMMRAHITSSAGAKWNVYRPLTNIMWLHYIIQKLLTAKRLRAPNANTVASRNAGKSGTYTERECYECLVEVERMLHGVVTSVSASIKRSGKERRKTEAMKLPTDCTDCEFGPRNAADVLAFGVHRGWVLAEGNEV